MNCSLSVSSVPHDMAEHAQRGLSNVISKHLCFLLNGITSKMLLVDDSAGVLTGLC